MPSPSQSLSAVVISGGKQYRVALGDRILVDRVTAEPGSELTLDRVLLVADGDDVKVGAPGIDGLSVKARVIGDAKGKKIDVLRYKSKKRVRVHRGARAALTALEIVTIGDQALERPAKPAKAEKAGKAAKPSAKPAKAETRAEAAVAAETAPEAKPRRTRATEAPAAGATTEEAPKAARRTRAKKAEGDEETSDGA